MSEWTEKSFGDLVIERAKSKIKVEQAFEGEDFPFFTSGEKILSYPVAITGGDNLFFATGGKANVKFYGGECAYSSDTWAVASKQVHNKYLYYWALNGLNNTDYLYFSGSGLKHLQKKDFRRKTVSYPSDVNEQAKIAEILSVTDEAIERTQEIIAKYRAVKEGLLQNLLANGIDGNGAIRSPRTHKYKPSPVGEIPAEWEYGSLKNYADVLSGSTPSTNEPKYWDGNNVWLTPNDLSRIDCMEIYDSERKLSKDGVIKSTGKLVKPDTVILSTRAPIGYCAVVRVPYSFNQGCKVIVPKSGLLPEYLYYWICCHKRRLIVKSSGTTFLELSKKELKEFLICKPKLSEQYAIVEKLQSADREISDNQNCLNKLIYLKQGLMQDLLTRKIAVDALL